MANKEEKAVKEKSKENKVKKHFFKDFKAELKKVIWPTPKQLVNNTIAVIVIVVIVSAIVFVLDAMFDAINKYGITELQNYVVEQFKKTEDESEDSNSQDDTSTENTTNSEDSTSTEDTTNNENSTESNQ